MDDLTDNPRYVPVLRWKGAEIEAVPQLTTAQRNRMKPVLEFVPWDSEKLSLDRAITLRARDISYSWGWNQPCFVDLALLDPSQIPAAFAVLDSRPYITATPVARLAGSITPPQLRDSVLVRKHGLALRLNAFEFRHGTYTASVLALIEQCQIAPEQVDILIDFALLEGPAPSFKDLVDKITLLAHWRSVTVLAGAFPPDLSKLKKNNQYLLPRTDWLLYRNYVLAGGTAAFGDYTIQHPIFEEHEKKGMNFSASIRYTGPADTVIMRGESVKTGGYEQWPANAQLLCERPEFCGADFSSGDRYIYDMSRQQRLTGGPKEWLTAGINHHIIFVLQQLEDIANTPAASVTEGEAGPDWPARMG